LSKAAIVYRTLFHRIDLRGRLTPEDLLSYFNDKDLRVIMGHNGININEFCAADKKYKQGKNQGGEGQDAAQSHGRKVPQGSRRSDRCAHRTGAAER
jgi:hypothetical protein